ncbi:MAG: 50S ribosomal protein L35 [bacterium]|nr:50S ribosomal protein L35 [bacterium]
MPKMKTHSASKKRFKKSGGKRGLIKHSKAYRRHLLTKKTTKCKRNLRRGAYISKCDLVHIKSLLPY